MMPNPQTRVILKDDGSVAQINVPDFFQVVQQAQDSNPDLVGRQFVDCDLTDLPPTTFDCAVCGRPHESFNQWTIKDGKVVRDETRPLPNVEQFHQTVADIGALEKGTDTEKAFARLLSKQLGL